MRLTRGVVIAVALVALSAGMALAAGGIKRSTGTATVAPDTSAVATAKCKKGTRVIGAGFSSAGEVFQVGNHGLVPKKKKVESLTINDGDTPADAKVEAICAGGIKAKVRKVTDEFTSGATHNIFVTCKKRETPLAGGWRVLGEGPPFWVNLNSLRLGRSWVISPSGSGGGTIRAYAVCAKAELDARRGPRVEAKAGAVVKSVATCPKGTVAASGGFKTDADEGTPFSNILAPLSSTRKGKRKWQVTGLAESAGGQYIQAIAYCTLGSPPVAIDPQP